MAQMIPLALTAAGTALSAGGTIIGAKAEAKQLNSEAGQLEDRASSVRASSQRRAMEERRQSRLASSRALALAAATGGASDPTVVNILAGLSGEGQYRALTALYEGEEEGRGLEFEASNRRKEAKNAKRAGYIEAAGSMLKAGSSMYEKYG